MKNKKMMGRNWRDLTPREMGIAHGSAHLYGEFIGLSTAGNEWARNQMRQQVAFPDEPIRRAANSAAARIIGILPSLPATRDTLIDFTDGFVAGAAWAADNLLGGTDDPPDAPRSGSLPPGCCPRCGGVYGELATEGGCQCDRR